MTSSARRIAGLLVAVSLIVPLGARATTTPLTFASTVLPGAGGEPNVSISPDGKTVLVDGLGGSPASLYRSSDGGKTFELLTPSFPKKGGGDFDMRWLDDRHVIAVDLSVSNGFYVDRSADGGQTWATTQIHEDVYDRPWIDHFGTQKVYVVAKGFDGVPYLYRSDDGGASFDTPPLPIAVPALIYGTGITPAAAGGTSPNAAEATYGSLNAYVDHITVDQRTGDVYVLYGLGGEDSFGPTAPLGASSRLYVAHLESGPAGDQMVSHPVYLGHAGDAFLAGFNWLAVDQAGTLYALANGRIGGHYSTRLSYSTDKGVTWSKLVDLGAPGASNVYGSIAGGAAGTLSLVYLRGSNDDPSTAQDWYAEMARISNADTAAPSIARVRPVAAAIHTKDICFDGLLCGLPGFGNNRDLLDYIWNAIDPSGHAFAVVASDGPASDGGTNGVSVIVLRQTAGPLHGAGVQS